MGLAGLEPCFYPAYRLGNLGLFLGKKIFSPFGRLDRLFGPLGNPDPFRTMQPLELLFLPPGPALGP